MTYEGRLKKLAGIITEETESVNPVSEDCDEHDAIRKSTWTEWQQRDGIYLVHPGSNSVYVGFCDQPEAEKYANDLGGKWKVFRHGRYKTMTDDETKNDPEIRKNRMRWGFYVEPIVYENLEEMYDSFMQEGITGWDHSKKPGNQAIGHSDTVSPEEHAISVEIAKKNVEKKRLARSTNESVEDNICFRVYLAGRDIILRQDIDGSFSVQLGMQENVGLSYEQAATRLGKAILYSLKDDGTI